jgi:NAD(P)-dependent dehydrogenase (short-subunit alcohol dehydrogenase family)
VNGDVFSLVDRSAVVTGGGSGLGRSIARALAERGAAVAVVDLDPRLATECAEGLQRDGARAVAIPSDVSVAGGAASVIAQVVAQFGRLDILVNNAGVAVPGPVATMEEPSLRRMFDVNVFGLLAFSQAAYPVMSRAGRGVIINMASTGGLTVLRDQELAAYASTKASVVMLTKALAVEWVKAGIRVNALAPGFMLTDRTSVTRDGDPTQWAKWMAGVPMNRPGLPSELDGAVIYLASDASAYVTGSVLVVDGGYTCL